METGAWHSANLKDVFRKLETREKGLTEAETKERLAKYGPNHLKHAKGNTPFRIFIEQFNSFLIWILLAAVLISFALKEYADGLVILAILLLNAILGFIQEYNAEKSLEALKKLAALHSTVMRDGREVQIDAKDLVPGDIVLLEEGSKVPADCRLFELKDIASQESTLTGESNSVTKSLKEVPADAILAEMSDMVFAGTTITRGRGRAVVVETGQGTQIGRIASLLGEVEEQQTPLQRNMEKLGKQLGFIVIGICIVILATGYFKEEAGFLEMLMVTVSLAVAAIPEGLPAVVTISLALGVKRMVRKNALIRKLSSVKTLGCTTVICTDKTGTLTHNEMTVRKIYTGQKEIDVTGQGYMPKGDFLLDGKTADKKNLELILKIGALCNNAKLNDNKETVIGDPTEGALIVSAEKAGLSKQDLEKSEPRIDELLFDSSRKRMSTVHKRGSKSIIYTKGAPESVLAVCDRIEIGGKVRKLTTKDRTSILLKDKELASKALRVLGFAYSEGKEEKGLIFVGLQGMIDPPRSEAKIAIEKCKQAGIRVVMITGDNELTALAIARELGIEGAAMHGRELEKADIKRVASETNIFARVNPEHKMRIVEALQAEGHVVAMTGDGVNDAPAIKKADIGIAMGITGTDVAKESSKMVLLDDNFVSIVNAVEEGRGIYDNIRKFVFYLLSCNMGEVLVVFAAIMLGLPLPIAALQILWMNLATDGLPALALGVDPVGKDVMQRKPRSAREGILNPKIVARMLSIAFVMTAVSLILFSSYIDQGLDYARTVAFTTLVVLQLMLALNTRSERSLFSRELFANKFLLLALFGSLALQTIVLYTPMNTLFETVPLSLLDWAVIIGASLSVLAIEELRKLISRVGA